MNRKDSLGVSRKRFNTNTRDTQWKHIDIESIRRVRYTKEKFDRNKKDSQGLGT